MGKIKKERESERGDYVCVENRHASMEYKAIKLENDGM